MLSVGCCPLFLPFSPMPSPQPPSSVQDAPGSSDGARPGRGEEHDDPKHKERSHSLTIAQTAVSPWQ